MNEQLLAMRARKLARDLIDIAKQAMPDSFLATDSRVLHARETLERLDQKRRKKSPAGNRSFHAGKEPG